MKTNRKELAEALYAEAILYCRDCKTLVTPTDKAELSGGKARNLFCPACESSMLLWHIPGTHWDLTEEEAWVSPGAH